VLLPKSFLPPGFPLADTTIKCNSISWGSILKMLPQLIEKLPIIYEYLYTEFHFHLCPLVAEQLQVIL